MVSANEWAKIKANPELYETHKKKRREYQRGLSLEQKREKDLRWRAILAANPEKRAKKLAKQKEWRIANREKHRAAWRIKHPRRIKDVADIAQRKLRERLKAKEYRWKNRDKIRQKRREKYRLEHPCPRFLTPTERVEKNRVYANRRKHRDRLINKIVSQLIDQGLIDGTSRPTKIYRNKRFAWNRITLIAATNELNLGSELPFKLKGMTHGTGLKH